MMQQLVYPYLAQTSNVGECGYFVYMAYGGQNGWGFQTARQAWDGQANKHPGEYPPLGVSVPIWHDYWYKGVNLGHASIRLADGRVLSSPYPSYGVGQRVLSSIAEMELIYGLGQYLGWSGSLDGTQIITTTITPAGEEEDDTMPDSMFAVVDGVPSWCWLNWATGQLFAVHTQDEANWVGSYMGSVKSNFSGDADGGTARYKNKLAMFGILAPKVTVEPGFLTDAQLAEIKAMVTAGVTGALSGATFTIEAKG